MNIVLHKCVKITASITADTPDVTMDELHAKALPDFFAMAQEQMELDGIPRIADEHDVHNVKMHGMEPWIATEPTDKASHNAYVFLSLDYVIHITADE